MVVSVGYYTALLRELAALGPRPAGFLGTKKPRGSNVMISTVGARSTCGVGAPVTSYNIAGLGARRAVGPIA